MVPYDFLQPGGNLFPFQFVDRPAGDGCPMRSQQMQLCLGIGPRAAPPFVDLLLLVFEIQFRNGSNGQLLGLRRRLGLMALRDRIGAKFGLRKTLASNLASGIERDLAGIAKAFLPLLLAYALLNNPRPALVGAGTAQADTKAGQVAVPLDVIDLAGRHRQRGHGIGCQFHG